MPLNHDRPFLAVNIALLTVSDTRNAADDRSGDTLAERAATAGHRIATRQIVRDDLDAISSVFMESEDFPKSLGQFAKSQDEFELWFKHRLNWRSRASTSTTRHRT